MMLDNGSIVANHCERLSDTLEKCRNAAGYKIGATMHYAGAQLDHNGQISLRVPVDAEFIKHLDSFLVTTTGTIQLIFGYHTEMLPIERIFHSQFVPAFLNWNRLATAGRSWRRDRR